MNLNSLSNLALHEQTLMAAKTEKAATFALLEYLAEVDARRLYSERGYSTLWLYVHKALGNSESGASERVSAVTLMASVPEVKAKIEAEELTLTSVIKLAAFVRREECEPEKTVQILEMISGVSTRTAEKILAREQTEPVLKRDHVKPSGPETTRVSFDADPEFMLMLEKLKNLQGNPELSICERLKAALKTEIERKESFKARRPSKMHGGKKARTSSRPKAEFAPKRGEESPILRAPERSLSSEAASVPKSGENSPILRTPEVELAEAPVRPVKTKTRSRFIPVSVKRTVAHRSGGRCEYVDTVSGKRCESRFGLEFDHFPLPFAMGGESTEENLRQACGSHNRLAAVRFYGREKMREFIR